MSRMFLIAGRPMTTWNVYVGCRYDCTFCNARKAALTRFQHIPRYKNGFSPHFVEAEMWKRFKPFEFVFVAYMGDISFATISQVKRILERIREFGSTSFLFLTKAPYRYWEWYDAGASLPLNVYLGATIETNRDYGLSKAPEPYERYLSLASIPHPHKFISIEPIMDFHLQTMVDWMKEVKPEIIEVGADNYHNHLLEPPWLKVEQLLEALRDICPTVVEKPGLERLKR